MKLLILNGFIAFFIQSLCSQTVKDPPFAVLTLSEQLMIGEEVPISRFVDNVSFILLETGPNIVISSSAIIEVTSNHIIVKNRTSPLISQILLFEKETGKFIREIGRQGRVPGEYYTYSNLPFNYYENELYATGQNREILAYDLTGRNVNRIKIPNWLDPEIKNESFRSVMISIENVIDSNIFVGYIINYSGWEKRKLVLFSKNEIIKVFPNHLTWIKENQNAWFLPPGGFAKFYNWNKKLFFIENFCDTLYEITKEALIPRYFFDFGKFNIPYAKQFDIVNEGRASYYFSILDIDENDKYIFLKFTHKKNMYSGFVDKGDNKVTVCKMGPSGLSALKDNLNGLMDIIPNAFTQNNEMIYIIQPDKLLRWFKENPEKEAIARKRFQWLKDIDQFSNPIVCMAKCKN